MPPQRVLFICIHNSARSQMARGLLRTLGGDRFEAFSAGIEAAGVRPETVTVMDEIGIDVRGQESKTLERYLGQPFDWLITVCDTARQQCPVFPGVDQVQHWNVEDPNDTSGPPAARLLAFRHARDDLQDRILGFVADTE